MQGDQRHPATYLPGARDLCWLVSESPRGSLLLDEFWEGQATAHELARVLWPEVNPDGPIGFPLHGATPAQWVAAVLDIEATPCVLGGAGTITKRGLDYIVSDAVRIERDDAMRASPRERPHGLPRWPASSN